MNRVDIRIVKCIVWENVDSCVLDSVFNTVYFFTNSIGIWVHLWHQVRDQVWYQIVEVLDE